MSIYDIQKVKELCKNAKITSREDITARIEYVLKCGQEDSQYQGLWEMVGRLCAIAQLCKIDGYMTEKIETGKEKEMDDLQREYAKYRGYGKIFEALNQSKEVGK